MTGTRIVAAFLIAAVSIGGCTGDEPAAPPSPVSGVPEGVAADRELLGQPTVELAERVIAFAEAVDEARFAVPRGSEMAAAIENAAEQVTDVTTAADAAETAAEGATVGAAGAVVEEAVRTARRAAADATKELRYLRRIARLDRKLLAAAAKWDRPGSQSELRAFLAELAQDVAALRPQARRLRPSPRKCTVMKANRREWVRTVYRRTQRLGEQANSAGGTTYDDLRAAYRRLPLGVEPRAADAAERSCWENRSAIPDAPQSLRDAVAQLEAALR